jgi:2-iminobutanoate/2-iminopropanoate deaminase
VRASIRVTEKEHAAVSHHREAIDAPGAPAAVGPYVHAVRTGGLLFCSGQLPLHPETGEIVGDSAPEQAGRVLENLQAVCAAAGASLADAVKITVYLRDMADFAAVNEVYGSFFESDPPARVAVAVAGLPRDAQVEMDAVVALER